MGSASIASAVLGSIMIGVIIICHILHINPDNVATPVAASLGDLVTLGLLSVIAAALYDVGSELIADIDNCHLHVHVWYETHSASKLLPSSLSHSQHPFPSFPSLLDSSRSLPASSPSLLDSNSLPPFTGLFSLDGRKHTLGKHSEHIW